MHTHACQRDEFLKRSEGSRSFTWSPSPRAKPGDKEMGESEFESNSTDARKKRCPTLHVIAPSRFACVLSNFLQRLCALVSREQHHRLVLIGCGNVRRADRMNFVLSEMDWIKTRSSTKWLSLLNQARHTKHHAVVAIAPIACEQHDTIHFIVIQRYMQGPRLLSFGYAIGSVKDGGSSYIFQIALIMCQTTSRVVQATVINGK